VFVSQVDLFLAKTRQGSVVRGDAKGQLNRIRAAVIEECSENSFQLASMARIAKRAKVSTASLYRSFGNRDALLKDVAHFTAPLIAAGFEVTPSGEDSESRVRDLLVQLGEVYLDPHAKWLFRAHVSLDVTLGGGLMPIALETSQRIEAIWLNEIAALPGLSDLPTSDMLRVINFLLGGVQRRTILALLLFGANDDASPSLLEAANSGVDWIVDVYAGHGARLHGDPACEARSQLAQEKSPVQSQVEEDLLSQHTRHDFDTRHRKILAAAVQECSQLGFKQASMAGVATRANVSTATLYDHFTDKADMFVKAVGYIVPVLTASVTQPPSATHPRHLISAMLVNHGKAYLDPFMAWLYRHYVSYEGQSSQVVERLGKASRAMTEAFWHNHLSALEQAGYLHVSDHAQTANLLLGGIERCTLLAFLLYGTERTSGPDLVSAADYAADVLFCHLGTPKYWSEFGEA
jgi:AcrR family transcriptional regulator